MRDASFVVAMMYGTFVAGLSLLDVISESRLRFDLIGRRRVSKHTVGSSVRTNRQEIFILRAFMHDVEKI